MPGGHVVSGSVNEVPGAAEVWAPVARKWWQQRPRGWIWSPRDTAMSKKRAVEGPLKDGRDTWKNKGLQGKD